MNDHEMDEYLHIQTAGEQMGYPDSYHYHRYEPTPYSYLQALFKVYLLNQSDHIVDFGCGKGRLNFYLHHVLGASVTGIEMNKDYYDIACDNLQRYKKKWNKGGSNQIQFYCCKAEDYLIRPEDNRFYFFNPFSIQIFRRIVQHIFISLEEAPREVDIILYYPSDEYIYYLDNLSIFHRELEIPLMLLGKGDGQERFIVYRTVYL